GCCCGREHLTNWQVSSKRKVRNAQCAALRCPSLAGKFSRLQLFDNKKRIQPVVAALQKENSRSLVNRPAVVEERKPKAHCKQSGGALCALLGRKQHSLG